MKTLSPKNAKKLLVVFRTVLPIAGGVRAELFSPKSRKEGVK